MNYSNLQSTLSSMFIQPQGSTYIINNSLEVSNVPLGAGVSTAICPPESLLYVKFYQDGAPVIQAYSLTPYDSKSREHELEDIIVKLQSKLDDLEKRLEETPIITQAAAEQVVPATPSVILPSTQSKPAAETSTLIIPSTSNQSSNNGGLFNGLIK